VLADLHRRSGDVNIARGYHNEALKLAPTPAIKELLERRFKKGEAD